MLCKLHIFLFIIKIAFGDTDSTQCLEVSTTGYSYNALYKLGKHEALRIDFMVKAQSDAHILLTSNPNVLELAGTYLGSLNRGAQVLEVLIGGGRNSFSEIRIGYLGGKKVSRVHEMTQDILSSTEYRGFWIDLHPNDGIVEVGRHDNSSVFLTAIASPNEKAVFQVSYFSISTWNHIKGHWRIDCGQQKNTEIEGIEETDLSGMAKLRHDLISFYDPSATPELANQTLIITTGMHVHHYNLDEKNRRISISGKMFLSWNDWKLSWNKEDHDNITSMVVRPLDIWTPNLRLPEFTSNLGGIQLDYQSARAIVTSDGNVSWNPSFQLDTFCDLNLDDWPRDKNECNMAIMLMEEFLPRQYLTNAKLETVPGQEWTNLATSSEWQLTEMNGSHLSVDVDDDDDDDETVSMSVNVLAFSLYFSRKNTPYITIFSVPLLSVTLMTFAAFWLRPNNPAKLYLGCVCSLLLSFLMVVIAKEIPVATKNVPTIVNLYMWGLLLSAGSILHYVTIKNLRECNWTLPYWCRHVLTNPLLETFLCTTASSDPTVYSNLRGESTVSNSLKGCILLAVFFERFVFIAYFIIFIVMWVIFLI